MLLAHDVQGSGPSLVLLHGFPASRRMWDAQAASLRSSYRVIVFDLRGQGASQAPAGVYTMDEMAQDVIETLDHLDVREPIVLGGLSMGGYVALALMARYPERVRGLILMDTRATADSPEAAVNREITARRVEETGSIEHVVASMVAKLFAPATREKHPERIEAMRTVMEQTAPQGIIGALRGMAVRPNRTAALAAITIPTLVMVGTDDVVTTPAEMRSMAGALPHATLVEIPEAGHMGPVENPEAVTAAILSFLNGLR